MPFDPKQARAAARARWSDKPDRRTEVVSLRLSPAEADALRQGASDAGLSLSDFIMQALAAHTAVGSLTKKG